MSVAQGDPDQLAQLKRSAESKQNEAKYLQAQADASSREAAFLAKEAEKVEQEVAAGFKDKHKNKSSCKCRRCSRKHAEEAQKDALKLKNRAKKACLAAKEEAGKLMVATMHDPQSSHDWNASVGCLSLWDQVAQLQSSDFPVRLFFLDKSGSMGCDKTSLTALGLATNNSLNPQRGSSLVFLLAGPSETQVFFRRPGDEPMDVSVQLGSCTWFNEPVARALLAIAPAVESIGLSEWSRQHGEPPIQVLCMTDGMDNMSPNSVARLPGLVRAIKQITGPQRGGLLYRPIAGSVDAPVEQVLGHEASLVPVWLLWIVLGSGGRQFLEGRIPKEVAIIDAVSTGSSCPRGRLSVVSSLKPTDGTSPKPDLADRVLVTDVEGGVGREALVTLVTTRPECLGHCSPPQFYTVLYADETEQIDVPESRCKVIVRAEPLPPRESEADPTIRVAKTPKQVSSLVEVATTDPKTLIEHTNPMTRIMDIARLPVGKIKEVSSEKLKQADGLKVKQVDFNPVPPEFLHRLMMAVGSASSFAGVPRLRNFSQRVAYTALEDLAQGCTVHSAHFFETYGANSGVRVSGNQEKFEGLNGRLEVLCRPVLAVIELLVELRVLRVREIRASCPRESCYCGDRPQQAFTAFDPDMPALKAAVRFFDLGWDAMKRCNERYERYRPRHTSKDSVALSNIETTSESTHTGGASRRSSSSSSLPGIRRQDSSSHCGTPTSCMSVESVRSQVDRGFNTTL